jgi:hypothetical protein
LKDGVGSEYGFCQWGCSMSDCCCYLLLLLDHVEWLARAAELLVEFHNQREDGYSEPLISGLAVLFQVAMTARQVPGNQH